MNVKRAKILIVDNDEQVLIALERELESEGYCTLSDLSAVDWFGDLQHTRHQAYRLLMFPFPPLSDPAEDLPRRGIHASVCKWEHSAIKEKIRDYLPG